MEPLAVSHLAHVLNVNCFLVFAMGFEQSCEVKVGLSKLAPLSKLPEAKKAFELSCYSSLLPDFSLSTLMDSLELRIEEPSWKLPKVS